MKQTEQYRKRMRIAKKILIYSRNTSTSYLQRRMHIGYSNADMLLEDISKLSGFRFLYKARKRSSKKNLLKKQK